MADAAVGAIIEALVDKLVTLAEEKISLVLNYKDDLKKLQGSLTTVEAFLHDAEKKKVTSSAVKVWLRDLEDLTFDADNVIDDIDYELLSKQVTLDHNDEIENLDRDGEIENKTVKEMVLSCFSFCCSIFGQQGYENPPILYRLEMGPRIKDINERLEEINQRATASRLEKKLEKAQDRLDAYENREENAFAKDPIFLGRENEVSEIVKMLITATPAEQKSSVLPILGMGGQGKTTFAREVYHDENIISHFGDNRVWVYVSEIFDVLTILKKILTSITKKKSELHTQQDILEELQKHLGAKKYLLVLDDVWNEDIKKWDDFVYSLSGISSAGNGYCMILTTRKEEVASIAETLPVHKLKGLSEDDCWSIIKAKAFKGGNVPLDFEEIGKNIAKKCQGLPLAAKVVGGLLSSMKSKDEWSSIEENWLSNPEDEKHISNVLKLSFDHLPSPSLKKCFAYCSIFPKGHEIEKERLVELWMAEGFLQTKHHKAGNNNIDMETTGSNNFNTLLRNSLLQYVRSDDYGNVTHCSIHDLVHDLAHSVLCGNDDIAEGVCKSRYIGYEPSGDGFLSIPKGQERYVRTLFFGGKVSDIKFFEDLESLHTLTLVGYDINDLPTSIRKLKHLRYLDISETSIRCLPDWIGELYHLQTFNSARINWVGSCLEELPDSMSCLISLRHLHISEDTALPREMGKLTRLQTLPHIYVGGENGCEISDLGKMKDLKGELEIRNLGEVRDENEAMGAGLIRKSGIEKIRLKWDLMGSANDVSVLEGLQPHPNLKSFEIWGFKGKHLPQWTSKMAVQLDGHEKWKGLNNLMEIKLCCCSEIEELPMLGHLPHLKHLTLEDLTNVNSIGRSFYGNVVVFPALERLELVGMPNLKEWDEVVVFPRLQYLRIEGCKQLMRAPSHFPCLGELKIYGMESNTPLENICGMQLTTLTRLTIGGIKELECLPDGLFSKNHNLSTLKIWSCPKMTRLVPFCGGITSLKELEIYRCPSLRELPDDLHSLNSLETLDINGCPHLKSIPYYPSSRGGGQQQQGFTSLRKLQIEYCTGLTDLPIEMFQSCALSLEKMKLIRLSSLKNPSEVIGCLHKMTRLTDLVISGVPKLSILYDGAYLGMGPSSSLYSDSDSDSSWNNVSFNDTLDAILKPSRFNSLWRLILTGMEQWDCLPDGIQHLTSLQELELSGFGIEALPDWFCNFSSVEKLILRGCKKLTTLPSKHAMQRLSKLKRLEIKNCPLLLKEKRCNNNSERPQVVDSEWPKIFHIPIVIID